MARRVLRPPPAGDTERCRECRAGEDEEREEMRRAIENVSNSSVTSARGRRASRYAREIDASRLCCERYLTLRCQRVARVCCDEGVREVAPRPLPPRQAHRLAICAASALRAWR